MNRDNATALQIYVRHQSGPSGLLCLHLAPEQRLQLIEALARGGDVEMPAQLELAVLPQWVTNSGDQVQHAVIPIHSISFNVDSVE